jgi:hypothetical protein
MRWTLLVTALILLALSATALAGNVGLGVMIGEPTGFSLKAWSGSRTAFDVAAGWSLGSRDWIYVHSDYLWHRYEFDVGTHGSLPYYFGVGGRVLLRDGHDSRVGVRVPLGLDFITRDGRFDFFVEVAPIIDLVPDTKLDVGGGIGARVYF